MKSKYLLMIALLPALMLASCTPSESAAPKESPAGGAAVPAADSTATPADSAKPADAAATPAEGSGTSTEAPKAASAEKEADAGGEWVSLFNGKDLEGWTPRGEAVWEVKGGVLTGVSPGKNGHIYAAPELTDLEIKGMFRITVTQEGKNANSGLYFRANPPADNVNGFPEGYEAQICNSQEYFTGSLWKPGSGIIKPAKLLTKDGEWFSMRVKAVGTKIEIYVNDELATTYEDSKYTKGHFAIQCHNSGMVAEAKDLYYRDLSKH